MPAGHNKKIVAFVLYPGLTILDLVGPLQAFTELAQNPDYGVTIVGERVEVTDTDTPLKVVPDKTFDEVPRPHAVFVPGGGRSAIRAMGNERIINYLRRTAESAELVGSICTGSLILGAAGLLEGRKATTHWAYHRLLDKLGAHYLPKGWVEDGKFITSAGVSAGIDMALYVLAKWGGKEISNRIQLGIEYDPQPPFGGIDWSRVNRDKRTAEIMEIARQALSDRPELLRRLTSDVEVKSGRAA